MGNTWNLIWTDYLGFNVGSYKIFRGTSPDQMSQIASISSSFTSYTDLNAPSGTIYYMIEVSNPNGCTPFKSTDFSSSRSNVATNKTLGVAQQQNEIKANIYPNPVSEKLMIQLKGVNMEEKISLQLSNMIGKVVYQDEFPYEDNLVIPVSQLQEGVYMLSVVSGDKKIARKIVVNHK